MAAPGDEGSGFYASSDESLARHGIGAAPEVFCLGGKLLLRDGAGGLLEIAAERVERLRLGFVRTKFDTYHETRLFLPGEAEPLLIKPRTTRDLHYAATMRRFAHAVAGARGLDRLERGLTGRVALLGIVVVLAVCTAASLMALLVWSKEHGMAGAVVFTAAMAGAAGLMTWHGVSRERPRPLASLDELERYLPRPR